MMTPIAVMLKYISPLTIAPSVSMIGISLFGDASNAASSNWYISMSTAFIMILVSQYIKDIPLPVPILSGKRLKMGKAYIFRLFPVLITILFMWLVCIILTVTEVLPEGDAARSDANFDLINGVDWFSIPYPCKSFLTFAK